MEKNATTDVVAVVAILAIVTFAVAWIINYPKDSGTPAVADEPENEVIESMKKFDKQQFEQSLKLSP